MALTRIVVVAVAGIVALTLVALVIGEILVETLDGSVERFNVNFTGNVPFTVSVAACCLVAAPLDARQV